MPANPADVAKYTNDGVVLTTDTAQGNAIAAAHADARDTGGGEIEMFFKSPAVGQAMLDEKFLYVSRVDPLHAGIEVEEALGLGTTIPIDPVVPSFRCIDDADGIVVTARTRAYAQDSASDRFSVEVLQ